MNKEIALYLLKMVLYVPIMCLSYIGYTTLFPHHGALQVVGFYALFCASLLFVPNLDFKYKENAR